MGEITKIAILFWASGVALVFGMLLSSMSIASAIMALAGMGIVFSVAWFIIYLRDQP